MSARKNTRKNAEHARMEKQSRAWTLYCQGQTQQAIGRTLGVNHGTVSRYLADSRRLWRETHPEEVNEHITDQLARIDLIEQQAWAGWEKSCQDAEIRRSGRETDAAGGTKEKGFLEKRGQAGDPSFLARMAWCVEERCRILGLYAAVKQEQKVNVTVTHERERLRSMSPDELVRLHRQSLGTAGPDRN